MADERSGGRDTTALVLAVLWIGGFGSIAALLVLYSRRDLPATGRSRAARVIAWVGLAFCLFGGIVALLASGTS